MIESLEVGMTRRQVKFVMGSPLIEDTFNADRWDYFYTVKRGEAELTRKLFSVHFKDDKLASWGGDLKQIANNADGTQEEEESKDVAPEDDEFMDHGTTEE